MKNCKSISVFEQNVLIHSLNCLHYFSHFLCVYICMCMLYFKTKYVRKRLDMAVCTLAFRVNSHDISKCRYQDWQILNLINLLGCLRDQGQPHLHVIRDYLCLCAQESFFAVLRELYVLLGIKCGLVVCKANIVSVVLFIIYLAPVSYTTDIWQRIKLIFLNRRQQGIIA